MAGSIDSQVDVGNLSLVGLNSFKTVLGALSADDVQPAAMLQMEQLGAVFPISGPVRAQVPDYLQRCKSTRLDRIGVTIGWRKGDAASIMSHSAGGQAAALLATCLENMYGNDVAAIIFYKLSKSLLPNSARLGSPKQLMQATDILARKLGALGFGTILAQHVVRIHSVYCQLQQKAPNSLLTSLSQDGMSDILSKFSRSLQEENTLVRVRGCASMGYIFALAVTLFSDDCIVTVENMIVHKGSQSSSISIEITKASGEQSLAVHVMGKIQSVLEIPVRPSRVPPSMKFKYHGHFAEYTRLCLQELGLICVPDLLFAMGTCILSLSDLIYVTTSDRSCAKPNVFVNLFSQIYGEQPRAHVHQRCEEALEMQLPLKWPSFSETLKQLKLVLAKSNQAESFAQLAGQINLYVDPSDVLLRIIDQGIASLAIHPHQGAVWQPYANPRTWNPCEEILTRGSTQVNLTPSDVLQRLFSWTDKCMIARSEGTTTLIPADILYFGSNLYHFRGLEIMDGLVFHEGRYHNHLFTDPDMDVLGPVAASESQEKTVCPSADGVHSDVSLAISENIRGLVLDCFVTFGGQRQSVNLRERVDQSFGVFDAYPCRHPRKTPLHSEYVELVQTNSVLRPDGRSGNHISIVQTAGSPTSQFLSLTKWEPAILCRKCCLNCAYDQAREKEIYKIIVA